MPLLSAWGKTDSEGKPAHHLAHHSMDVAAVVEGLLALPAFARRLDAAAGCQIQPDERHWLAAFAFLHDVGKLSPRFQTKAWPKELGIDKASHLEEGWLWLEDASGRQEGLGNAVRTLFAPLLRAGEDVFLQWMIALFAHHGRPVEKVGVRRTFPEATCYDWRTADAEMGEALNTWFGEPAIANAAMLCRTRLVHLFAGLLTLADWIGSDPVSFPPEMKLDLAGYAQRARKRARAAIARVALATVPWPETEPTFHELTGFAEAHGHQTLISMLSTETPLAILEAETGSGKTEAALLHFARLRSAGRIDSIYFAVPTRAAARQLQERVQSAMRRIGGPDAVLAIPGQLLAGEAQGSRLPGFEVRWDDGKQHWAAEHSARFLAAPVAVGTIDQALMAALQVRHAPLRGSALSRGLLVIDEVHASDVYMNAIARQLVRDHLALGGHALLMSATLGSFQRAEWLDQELPGPGDARSVPYPAVWVLGETGPRTLAGVRSYPQKRVNPRLVATMDPQEAARMAIEAATHGARVLVVRNTVDAAVATWRTIIEANPEHCLSVNGIPALHHSRFAAEDRALRDASVEATFGKHATRSGAGVIAVGTQTLEQSLDIDADILISDLCPMDVLLQRIGRLHRHADRVRPAGFEDAVVYVLCPGGGLDRLTQGKFENGLGSWQKDGRLTGVYIDMRIVEATRRLVESGGTWAIPADNRALVETATHPDSLDEIAREMGWENHGHKIGAKLLAEGQHAGMLTLERGKPFPHAFPDADEIIQTRLGAMGPLIELPEGTIGPFGEMIARIAPPAHWCKGLAGDEPVAVSHSEDGLRITLGDRTFLYDRAGIRRRQFQDVRAEVAHRSASQKGEWLVPRRQGRSGRCRGRANERD